MCQRSSRGSHRHGSSKGEGASSGCQGFDEVAYERGFVFLSLYFSPFPSLLFLRPLHDQGTPSAAYDADMFRDHGRHRPREVVEDALREDEGGEKGVSVAVDGGGELGDDGGYPGRLGGEEESVRERGRGRKGRGRGYLGGCAWKEVLLHLNYEMKNK